MKVTHNDAQMTANQARYAVSERVVECLGGARATFPDGTLQAERMYWDLDAGMLRCPDTVTGTLQGVPFTAQGLTVDIKNRTTHANHITFQLRSDLLEKLQSLETKTQGKGKTMNHPPIRRSFSGLAALGTLLAGRRDYLSRRLGPTIAPFAVPNQESGPGRSSCPLRQAGHSAWPGQSCRRAGGPSRFRRSSEAGAAHDD